MAPLTQDTTVGGLLGLHVGETAQAATPRGPATFLFTVQGCEAPLLSVTCPTLRFGARFVARGDMYALELRPRGRRHWPTGHYDLQLTAIDSVTEAGRGARLTLDVERTWRPAACFDLHATLTASATSAVIEGELANHCLPVHTTLKASLRHDPRGNHPEVELDAGSGPFTLHVPLTGRPEDITLVAAAAGASVTFHVDRTVSVAEGDTRVFTFERTGRAEAAPPPVPRGHPSRRRLWGLMATIGAAVIGLGVVVAVAAADKPSRPVVAATTTTSAPSVTPSSPTTAPSSPSTTTVGATTTTPSNTTTSTPTAPPVSPPLSLLTPTTTDLTVDGRGPYELGETITLHASVATVGVGPMRQLVEFSSDGHDIGTGAWDGETYVLQVTAGSAGLGVGSHLIGATYAGDGENQPSISNTVELQIDPPAPT